MIERLAERVVNWQIEKSFLKSEEYALYRYAYEVLINLIVNILISISIAILLHAPMPVFVFLISYMPLRSYCGGYHAKTNGGCIVVSTLLIIAVCMVVKFIPAVIAGVLPPLSFVISGLLVLRYAPVEAENKPLSEEEVVRYRLRARYIWLAEAFIGMVFFLFKSPVGIVIALSHFIMCIMLYIGAFNNQQNMSKKRPA